jgi:hypothetical protein
MPVRSRRLLFAVVVLLVALGCGGPDAPARVEPVAAPEVPAPLRFRGETLSDGVVDLSLLAGRPVALWLCSECAKAASTVEVVHRVAGDAASVVGVTCSSTEAARDFEATHELSFPTLVDGDGTLTATLGIPCQPAYAFVGVDGDVQVVSRPLDVDELTERLGVGL